MRMILFFDLPVARAAQRKEYRRFRKFLVHEGFIMMQESVYTKLVINRAATQFVRNKIYSNKPKEGLVQMIIITEKQFESMDFILGDKVSRIEDSTNRLIIL